MLDVQTLLFMLVLIDVLLAATMWAAIPASERQGLRAWTLGLLMHALVFTTFGLRSEETRLASTIASSVFAASSIALQADAILRFFNRRLPPWVHGAYPALMGLVMAPLHRHDMARVAVGGVCFGAALFGVGFMVHRVRETERGLGSQLLTAGYAAASALLFLRVATVLIIPSAYGGFTADGVIPMLTALIAFGIAYVTSLGFLLLNRERHGRMIAHLATVDGLTGIFNRRTFFNLAEMALSRAQRAKLPVSMLLLDLDHFKRVNDAFGHQAGDAVLQRFVEVVQGCLRKEDLFTRYGGEEFCVLLMATAPAEAHALADRLREAVEKASFEFAGQWIEVTVSVGVSSLHPAEVRVESLLRRADEALYRAKRDGRNRIAVAP